MYTTPLPASQVSNKEASFGKGATWEKKARVILEEWNKESQYEIPQAVEKNVYTLSCNPHTVILEINECVPVEPGPDLSLGIGVPLATRVPAADGLLRLGRRGGTPLVEQSDCPLWSVLYSPVCFDDSGPQMLMKISKQLQTRRLTLPCLSQVETMRIGLFCHCYWNKVEIK